MDKLAVNLFGKANVTSSIEAKAVASKGEEAPINVAKLIQSLSDEHLDGKEIDVLLEDGVLKLTAQTRVGEVVSETRLNLGVMNSSDKMTVKQFIAQNAFQKLVVALTKAVL